MSDNSSGLTIESTASDSEPAGPDSQTPDESAPEADENGVAPPSDDELEAAEVDPVTDDEPPEVQNGGGEESESDTASADANASANANASADASAGDEANPSPASDHGADVDAESEPASDTDSDPAAQPSADDADDAPAQAPSPEPEADEPPAEAEAESDETAPDDDANADSPAQLDGSATDFEMRAVVSQLRTFIGAGRQITNEVKLEAHEDRLAYAAVDPANVAMVDVDLDASLFEEYDSPGCIIGIQLEKLQNALKQFATDSVVSLSVTDERQFVIEGPQMTFNLAALDPQGIRKQPDIPDIELDTELQIQTSAFKTALSAVDLVADHLRFTASSPHGDDDGEITHASVSASGDTDSMNQTLVTTDAVDNDDSDSASDAEIVSIAESNTLVSLDYLKKIKSGLPSVDQLTLKYGTEFPINITAEFSDGAGSVLYMVAPRIQSD